MPWHRISFPILESELRKGPWRLWPPRPHSRGLFKEPQIFHYLFHHRLKYFINHLKKSMIIADDMCHNLI